MWYLLYFTTLPCVSLVIVLVLKKFYLSKLFLSNIHDKAVFITGCDNAFGHELALALIQKNIRVYAGCLTKAGQTSLQLATKKCTENWSLLLTTLHVDVTNQLTLKIAAEAVANTSDKSSELWAIVYNSGSEENILPDDWQTIEDYKRAAEGNLWGVIRTCHEFSSLLKGSHGRVIITTGAGGRCVVPGLLATAVSRHGLEAYCDGLKQELKPWKVTVHFVEPGLCKSAMSNVARYQSVCKEHWDMLPESVKAAYGESYLLKWCSKLERMLQKRHFTEAKLVTDAYFHAIFGRFPQQRYLVGKDAFFATRGAMVYPVLPKNTLAHKIMNFMSQKHNKPISKRA